MSHYLDVAATRIQQWLGRSATLRGRRGASRMLAERTRKDAVQRWVATRPELAGVRWNDEGGDVDGVVTLLVPDALEPRDVAQAMIRKLREGLPRVELHAVTALAPSYVEAQPMMLAAVEDGDDLVIDLAPPRSVPLARVCQDCGRDGVVREQVPIARDEDRDVCADCEARYAGAGWTTGRRAEIIPGPELDLAEWLAAELPDRATEDIYLSFPDDFAQLARAATGPDGLPGTHTALVFADGNRVGEFIKQAVKEGVAKATLAPIVTEANRAAVVAATARLLGGDPAAPVPVSPHLIAGDDLLLSLPATLVWPFLRTYLPGVPETLSRLVEGKVPDVPTVSAGVVIAGATYPFTDLVSLAEKALKRAKKHERGAASAVCWVDVTRDGPEVRDTSPVIGTDVLLAHEQALNALVRETSASLRHTLRAAPEPREVVDRLGARAVRPFLDNAELPLPLALDLVRWWR